MIGLAEDIALGEVLDLPEIANEVILNLSEQLMALHRRVRRYEERPVCCARYLASEQ